MLFNKYEEPNLESGSVYMSSKSKKLASAESTELVANYIIPLQNFDTINNIKGKLKRNYIPYLPKYNLSESMTVIKEKTIAYLNYRSKFFNNLLTKYPLSEKQILEEAKIDIPSICRNQIYTILLGLAKKNEYIDLYNSIDKDIVYDAQLEKQLELDIIRYIH